MATEIKIESLKGVAVIALIGAAAAVVAVVTAEVVLPWARKKLNV